ncbi:acyl carrier protein [Sphingobium sp. GW456-12-10-14-TSB1]|jgi:acyl carrier protein|uniref:Acyl carrier protein n=1 Tax=Sphingobium algorifonticola TaxID=2008318 RepID=A0A437J2N9_9SPHN|nr:MULTISPECIES: acyl carrier protein [Sphingomonadaceae]OUC54853.1 acyl carrier protein [Sphingobium sp. GW456-12-10-14-TSB1]RVT38485.1 acyl carrier protein [Sphingobium algorifonticola]
MSDISDRVIEIIVKSLGVYPDQVRMEASFHEDIGADSLDVVELVMALEDEFEIAIPDDAVGGVKTVEDAVKLVESFKS